MTIRDLAHTTGGRTHVRAFYACGHSAPVAKGQRAAETCPTDGCDGAFRRCETIAGEAQR